MKLLHQTRRDGPTDLSIVLVDWSCRESFHVLDHLARQDFPRERFEVIWVEFYDARPAGIERRMADARREGRPAPVDVHVVVEAPRDVHYHKHVMYNVGIALASGRRVCICDSDAMVGTDFVESIVRTFAEHGPGVVLHLDQVRNDDRRFYPFNDPTPAQITGPGAINWINGRPAGLWDTIDPLHSRNYGACMAAERDDLLAIGGADEHDDYLGHICGPYEMTFRLINAGKRERWHEGAWLYHVWHPGQAGDGSLMGPHDGWHMSTTALAARESGRVEPLVENPAIHRLRNGGGGDSAEDLLSVALDAERLAAWRMGRFQWPEPAPAPAAPTRNGVPELTLATKLRLGWMLATHVAGQMRTKLVRRCRFRRPVVAAGDAETPSPSHVTRMKAVMRRMVRYERRRMRQCWRTLKVLRALGRRRIVLYGVGRVASIIRVLSRDCGIEIAASARWDGFPSHRRWPGRVVDEADLAGRDEPVMIAADVGIDRLAARLVEAGVSEERIWRLG